MVKLLAKVDVRTRATPQCPQSVSVRCSLCFATPNYTVVHKVVRVYTYLEALYCTNELEP